MVEGTLRDGIANAADLPARCAYRLFNLDPVSRLLGRRYEQALAAHRPRLPVLSGIDADIVAGVRHHGVHVTSLAELGLPGAADALTIARQLSADFADTARARVRDGHDFNIVPPDAIVRHPALFRLGLDDRLLDIAEAYLGLPAAYDGVHIIYTVADGRAVSTRQWHRDWEDRRMLKMILYCNDVGAEDGPLQVMGRADFTQTDATGFRYDTASRADMVAMFGADFEREVVSCTGSAGSVVFTDTARYFHRGLPAVRNDRQAVFYSYFAQRPRHPFLCERSGLSRRQIARLADGLPPRQRAAALWPRTLPLPMRLIPPRRL